MNPATTSNPAPQALTLVILAAGIGSRYGGLKQLDGFGPSGETIMDYSVFDARRAGFGRIVFVIRPDIEDAFRAAIGSRYDRHIPVAYVHQTMNALPSGYSRPAERVKPYGTGHAVLCAASEVDGPFAVANADDFYGARSFAALAEFITQPQYAGTGTYAMVGYRLRDTMSERGTVSRGVCRYDEDGWLTSITEITKIEKDVGDGRYVDDAGEIRGLPGETIVSMNLWGFQRRFVDELREGFVEFLRGGGHVANREFYLPFAVQRAMRSRDVRVKVLKTSDAWCGVTHRDDRPAVEAVIRGLVERGVYPKSLWT